MELKSSKLASVTSKKRSTSLDNISVRYHKIFDYKLIKEEAIKWQYQNQKTIVKGGKSETRLQREKYSQKKLKIAKKSATLISKIPTVLFVGVTGSLAMMNAEKNSDIDLLIITRKNTLWTTRALVYGLLRVVGYQLRKPEQKNEKDKLCLNMWLDETSLVWEKRDRNIYTAHEIAQIVPLINKSNIYQRFLSRNKWILNYWPNAVAVQSTKYKVQRQQKLSTKYSVLGTIFEKIAFKLQYFYMKSKITTEIITPHMAIFHKNDWGKVVMKKLNSEK